MIDVFDEGADESYERSNQTFDCPLDSHRTCHPDRRLHLWSVPGTPKLRARCSVRGPTCNGAYRVLDVEGPCHTAIDLKKIGTRCPGKALIVTSNRVELAAA